MWVLESDGDAFKGKKFWLRPGKKFLFGRTQGEDGQFVVSDKTISRKHLTVEVAEVQGSDCANVKTRSRVTLTDLDTKIGTLVNGEQIRGKSVVLDKAENTVSLGKYKHHFLFTWVPIVLSYMFTSKELKANPFNAIYERLGPLDVKVLQDFKAGTTTHLVAKKRNTSKGLQALIGGKHIVYNDSFAQALVKAATPVDGPAPLEVDFEANFPDPLEYLPPKGEEPTERDQSSYAPDPARQDMFEGYTFVFYEKRQYDNLFAPITEGGGKVSLMQAVPGQTTVDEFVRFVKGLAGEKGLGSFEDGSEGKGVVVVRFNPVKGDDNLTDWYAEFGRSVALSLDHRLIEQNEFLDAILGNDASVLRRPLEVESSGVVAPPPTATTNVSFQAPQSSAPVEQTQASMAPPSPPARRGRSRRTGRKFIGFDDDDFTGPPASSIPESMPESMAIDPPPIESQPHSQGLFVTQDPNMEVNQETSPIPDSQADNANKRKRSPSPRFEESEEEVDVMERFAPTAAAAIKKQKSEQGSIARSAPVPKPKVREPTPPPKVKQEINVVEITRKKNEEAAALAKAEREALQAQLEGIDIEQIRNLAIIEEMPVVRKPPPIRTARADESDRWDDRWNGRKDFGRFRRRGAAVVRPNRVIVALEEVKGKDYGIGDKHWPGEGDSQRKRKKNGKESQTQSTGGSAPKSQAVNRVSQMLALEAEDEFDHSEHEQEHEQEAKKDHSDSDLEEIIAPPSRAAARAKATVAASSSRGSRSQKSVPSQESSTQSRSLSGSKRAAESAATSSRQPPPKKQKQLGIMRKARSDDEDEEEDSEDDMKFKFRRKR